MEEISSIDPTQQALAIISANAPEMLPANSTKDLYNSGVNEQLEQNLLSAVHAIPQNYNKTRTLPPVYTRFTKEEVEEVLENCNGITTNICFQLDCTPRQLYMALKKYDLMDFMKECKKNLVSIAENAILECLHSPNDSIKLRAAEITVKSLGKDEWSTDPSTIVQTQINVQDKDAMVKNIFGISEKK